MTDVILLHGNCLELMPTLPAQSVQMVFADLPYASTSAAWDVLINLPFFWAALKTPCRSNAQCVFTANMRLAAALIASNAKRFRHDLVWHKKGRPSGFLQASKQPLRVHEHVLIFSLGPHATYVPQMTQGKAHDRHKYQVNKSGGVGFKIKTQKVKPNHGTRHPQTLLSINRLTGTQQHPTQKPVALLEWLIKTYTNPGDTILDPVAGSGTTAIATMRVGGGRRAICIEKDATYFAAMTKRVADERARLVQASLAI